MQEIDYTTIPEQIKKRRPHIDVRLYGNRACPHCQGRNIHRVRKQAPGGFMTVLNACPMALVETIESISGIEAIRAYLQRELPSAEEREKLNKSKKVKDRELKAFFVGVEKAIIIIKDSQL